MGSIRYPFSHVVIVVAATGTNLLQHDNVRSGSHYCYQHVGVINETNPYTRLRLLVKGLGQDHLLVEEQAPVANSLYWSHDEQHLIENEIMTAELTGCTASDVLKLYVRGWYTEADQVG